MAELQSIILTRVVSWLLITGRSRVKARYQRHVTWSFIRKLQFHSPQRPSEVGGTREGADNSWLPQRKGSGEKENANKLEGVMPF